MFFVEVTDSMKVNAGGGLESEGEMIDVVELSIEDARNMIQATEVTSPIAVLFAFMWFFRYKQHLI